MAGNPGCGHRAGDRVGVWTSTLVPDDRLAAAGLPANAEHRVFADAAADACEWDDLTIAWPHSTPSLDALYADRDKQVVRTLKQPVT